MMTDRQKARLRAAMEHIDAHPEQWDQTIYGRRTECGTTGCLAGWIVMLDDPRCAPPTHGAWTIQGASVRYYARDLAGLKDCQADLLFAANNGIDELRRGVQALLDSDGEIGLMPLHEAMTRQR